MTPNKPHKAILNVTLEVHLLLDTGECSGHVMSKKGLDKYGLKPNFILNVDGCSMEDCLNNLKKKLEAFNDE